MSLFPSTLKLSYISETRSLRTEFFLFCSQKNGLSVLQVLYTSQLCSRRDKKFQKSQKFSVFTGCVKSSDASTFFLITIFKLIYCFVLYVFEFVLYCLTTRKKIVKLGHRVAGIWLCKDNHRFFETKDRVLEVNNWIPTTVSWILFIF